jgi:NAD(P)-dependent dehydrogenase (short-subunit alcohol dehydrogenase family)
VVVGAAREVTVGTVRALLESGWIVTCPAGHHAPPDVGAAVAAEVLDRLPRATRRRLARTDRCVTCDAPLDMPVRRTERPVPVADVAGLPVHTVRFDVPSTRCLACATDQVPVRSQEDLRDAVLALFAVDAGSV